MRAVALLAILASISGCFGYNPGAKKWAYVGNSVLIAGGGGAITADVLTKPDKCEPTDNGCYHPPFGGAMVAGVILVTAGIVGIVINATRSDVKTSR